MVKLRAQMASYANSTNSSWITLNKTLLKAILNYGFEKRQIPRCQRRGIMRLVSKKDPLLFFLTLKKHLILKNEISFLRFLTNLVVLTSKSWVQTSYCSIACCVTNNGYASQFFNLERGVRQGCPLSGTLFVLGNNNNNNKPLFNHDLF